MEGKGWVKATELNVGDNLHLYTNGAVEITGIKEEFLNTPVKVYNFEVEHWNSYCVSELDVLVHNCGNGMGNNDGTNPDKSKVIVDKDKIKTWNNKDIAIGFLVDVTIPAWRINPKTGTLKVQPIL